MLKAHMDIAREGLRNFKVVRDDYAKRTKDLPRDRRMISRVEFLRRTEPLMERIAAGDLPVDATTAHILQEHMKEEEKLMAALFGSADSE